LLAPESVSGDASIAFDAHLPRHAEEPKPVSARRVGVIAPDMVDADCEFAAARQVPQCRGLALRIEIGDRPSSTCRSSGPMARGSRRNV
jgi:hypothetical protein